MIRKMTALLLCLTVCFTMFTFTAACAEDESWTVLIYICGSDLESEQEDATENMEAMLEAPDNDNVHIVIETGGAKKWYNGTSAKSLTRFVRDGNQFKTVDTLPKANMGDASTLQDFISWGVQNYPAAHTALILWNHGSGSIDGVCFDELYNEDSLSLTEIGSALEATKSYLPNGFEFVGYDACLMATLENACMLVPYAHYLYASEEVEPGTGWDYKSLFTYLSEHPDTDGKELGEKQCQYFYDFQRPDETITFSVVDLTKISDLVTAFDKVAQEVNSSDSLTGIVRAIIKADNFGGNTRSEGYFNMVDVLGLLQQITSYAPSAQEAITALQNAVIAMKNGKQHKNAGGLSLYYPLSIQGSEELDIFKTISPSSNYTDFVNKVASTAGTSSSSTGTDTSEDEEESGSYWDSTSESTDLNVTDIYFDDDGYFTVALESTENLAYATCAVFYIDEEDEVYLYLGEDDNVYIDDDYSLVSDNFDGTWMSLDDYILPIELVSQNDSLSVYTCTILLNGEETNLRVSYDWDKEEFSLLGTYDSMDKTTGAASRIQPLNDGDVINIVYSYVDDNDNEGTTESDDITVSSGLNVETSQLPEGDYEYYIVLYDLSGNGYTVDPCTFNVDENGDISYYDLDDYDYDDDAA